MDNLIFEVSVLNKYEDEIGYETICAKSETEMWDIFDKQFLPNYPEYDNAAICDVYLA